VTLTILDDLEQGTPDWHAARCGILTASVIGRLITPKTIEVADNPASRSITMQLAAERITEYTEPTYVSSDMEFGHVVEPVVRDLYSETWEPVTECGFMIREDHGTQIGYSPDGLVGDNGLLETKSRDQKTHLATIWADSVPPENMAQCQTGLYVSGRDWIDYVSYCGGMRLWRKRVYPDPRWQAAIIAAGNKFETAVEQIISIYYRQTAGMPATKRIVETLELI